MSEEKNDKILRQQLQNLQVPYDAQAWNQMEAMLNKEQKKRGFIFWFTGAFCALLIMGSAAIYFYHNTKNNFINTETQTANNNITSQENNPVTNKKNISTSQPSATNNATIFQPENNFSNKNEALNNTVTTSVKNTLPEEKIESNNSSHKLAKNNNSKNSSSKLPIDRGSQSKKDNKTGNNIPSINAIAIANNNTNQETLIPFFIAGIEKIIFEPAAMEFIDVKNAETNETTIVAPNKKKVHYALGISGIVAATTVGQQENATHNFFSKPYYAVGFAQEVQFGKRLAITNAFQYGKNYFEINSPRNNTFETQPEKYSCAITMLNIPVGVKFNIVAKEKFSWYVHAGINNHIKLKENFEFLIYPIDTTQPNPTPIPTNVSVQTNLSGGLNTQYEAATEDFATSGNVRGADVYINNTNDFSINNAKRYYASAYVATGVAYILKNKWHFFVEPTYQFSLHPIGIQEKTIKHLGVGSGFRFQF